MEGDDEPVGSRQENVERPRKKIRQDRPQRDQGEWEPAERPPRNLRRAEMGYEIRHG